MPKTRRVYTGNAVTATIAGGLTAGSTSCVISVNTGWPSNAPFYCVVDPGLSSEEKILVTAISGTTLSTITRGQDGTSDQTHAAGCTIYPVFTSLDADEANELTAKYTTRGDIVYQGASTFERLAKGAQHTVLKAGANDPAWGLVTNDNVDASAAIVDTKLATISTANKVSVAALDIDGATDIGADLVDADLVIVDDGAGGTNRKSAISRFAKYLFGKVSGEVTVTEAGVATTTGGLVHIGTSTAAGTSRSLSIDNVFSSTYDNYRIVGKFRASGDGNNLFLQLRQSNGTLITSNNEYKSTAYGLDYETQGTTFSTLGAGVTNVGYVGWLPNSTNLYISFVIDLYGPAIATDRTMWTINYTGFNSGTSALGGFANGSRSNATNERGISFDNGGASNMTGSVSVFGYRK